MKNSNNCIETGFEKVRYCMRRKRNALKKGAKVQTEKSTFEIVSVAGMGATCIVYEAEYTDDLGTHAVYLKECYPAELPPDRDDSGELLWSTSEQQKECFDAFKATYIRLLGWQKEMFSPAVSSMFSSNNTRYFCMPYKKGEDFRSVEYKKLKDILEAVKTLASIIKKYHDDNCLHLDIKPDNFIVDSEINHMLLFDMDTVMSIDDANSGGLCYRSYSEDYAAPEQTGVVEAELGFATDIFAIGVVLFEKIMCRIPATEDKIAIEPWVFNGDFFKKVNPLVKRKVKVLFCKTLALLPEERYQTVDELIEALDDVIKSIDKPFITSRFNKPQQDFLCRTDELHQIDVAFIDSDVVILQGDPGVGKSELAKKYAENNADKYDKILQLNYKGSLKDLLSGNDLVIHNCDTETFDEKEKQLSDIMQAENILFIIDNANEAFELDEYRKTFFGIFRAKFLITTKCTNFERIFSGVNVKAKKIKVGALSNEELKVLFVKKCSRVLDDEEYESIDNILAIVDGCTLLVPVLARYTDHLTVAELAERLQGGLRTLKSEVPVNKDDDFYQASPLEILKIVWNWDARSSMEEVVLQTMCFLRNIMLSRRDYCEYLKPSGENEDEHLKVINSLMERGWIQEAAIENERFPEITLHSLVVEMIQSELRMDISKNQVLTAYMDSACPKVLFNDGYFRRPCISYLDFEKISNWSEWFSAVCGILDFSLKDNVEFVVDILYTYLDDIFWRKTNFTWLEKFESFADGNKGNTELLLKIVSILVVVCTENFKEDKVKEHSDLHRITFYFTEAQEYACKLEESKRPYAFWYICRPVLWLYEQFPYARESLEYHYAKAMEYQERYPDAFEGHLGFAPIREADGSNLPDIKDVLKWDSDSLFDADEWLQNKDEKYIEEIEKIMEEEQLSNKNRCSIYFCMAQNSFPTVCIKTGNFDKSYRDEKQREIVQKVVNTNWERLCRVLKGWESIRQSFSPTARTWQIVCMDAYNVATLAVMQGDSEEFRNKMDLLYIRHQNNIEREIQGKKASSLRVALDTLANVGKAKLALLYAIKEAEWLEQISAEGEYDFTSYLFNRYNDIIEYAFWADDDATYNKYQRKANVLSEKKTIKKDNKTE